MSRIPDAQKLAELAHHRTGAGSIVLQAHEREGGEISIGFGVASVTIEQTEAILADLVNRMSEQADRMAMKHDCAGCRARSARWHAIRTAVLSNVVFEEDKPEPRH